MTTLVDTFSLLQLLQSSATVLRRPARDGSGMTAAAEEVGTIGRLEIVPAAQFGRIFGATPPMAGGKAGFIALMILASVAMDAEGDTLRAGDTLVSGGQSYAVVGQPAPWLGVLLAADCTMSVAS